VASKSNTCTMGGRFSRQHRIMSMYSNVGDEQQIQVYVLLGTLIQALRRASKAIY